MLKRLNLKIALLSFVLVFLITSVSLPQTSYRATVLKISDGDTVWVMMGGEKVKLRLLGIDTPEKFESKKLVREAAECGVSPGYMKNLGQLATHHAKKYLHKGQQVEVIVYGYGYYGRALAVIRLPDGRNFNEAMVADGYACVYKYRGHKSRQISQKEFDRLVSLMNDAKRPEKVYGGNTTR